MKELGKDALHEVNGGTMTLPSWFKGSIWVIAAGYIIEHWAELKSGIVDGYTDGMNSN
ncbi:MAG: hypothetical protein M1292_06530 [Bacteroidetes bacterium]|nr:hypothetical protein [Bacteroidota bacterium]